MKCAKTKSRQHVTPPKGHEVCIVHKGNIQRIRRLNFKKQQKTSEVQRKAQKQKRKRCRRPRCKKQSKYRERRSSATMAKEGSRTKHTDHKNHSNGRIIRQMRKPLEWHKANRKRPKAIKAKKRKSKRAPKLKPSSQQCQKMTHGDLGHRGGPPEGKKNARRRVTRSLCQGCCGGFERRSVRKRYQSAANA